MNDEVRASNQLAVFLCTLVAVVLIVWAKAY